MTKEEYRKKIDELNKQIYALNAQIGQVNKEFKESSLRELEEQGITPGTKVSVKTKTWSGYEVDTVTCFFGVSIEFGEIKYIFNKIKKDGTMSKRNQFLIGTVISIDKI